MKSMSIINYILFNIYLMLFATFSENVVCNITYFDCNKITEFTFKFYTLDFSKFIEYLTICIYFITYIMKSF